MSSPDLTLKAKSSARSIRSHSISSDRTSLTGFGAFQLPSLAVSPEAGFIAASAASQIVTNDHDTRAEAWFDQHGIEPSGETALVSPPALKLVNRFLDQLLLHFLSISKSTSLAALRPAVIDVLKTKLAKDAIYGAEQELQEYLGGTDDEELLLLRDGAQKNGQWDLELVWKRTRLRCMVYSSLGDMEEDDEDFYTEKEQLDASADAADGANENYCVVSPAVAIFLTSILEYMGEQVLIVAGQSAYNRLRAKHEKDERDGTSSHGDIAERVVVEEFDMERVALDRTIGRLWRVWKKKVRSPKSSISLPRSFSRESFSTQKSRSGSPTTEEPGAVEEFSRPSLAAVLAEFEHAVGIPLPMTTNDVREIEIPGLATQSDDEVENGSSEDEELHVKPRPKSMVYFRGLDSPITNTSSKQQPGSLSPISRKRSNSLPSPGPSAYNFKRPKTSSGETDEVENVQEDALIKNDAQIIEAGGDDSVRENDTGIDEVPKPAREALLANEKENNEIDQAPKSAGETIPGVEPQHTKESGTEDSQKNSNGGILAGAAAIGATVVTGIIAAANGKAPPTNPAESEKDETDTEEEAAEEPQIMTSSRVSFGGHMSPENVNTPSRQSSIRSRSVQSLRLIDVAAPRSPSGSRHGSMDASEVTTGRPLSLSRSGSTSHPAEQTRVASPVSRAITSSPIVRNASSLSNRQSKSNTEHSIMEEKEVTLDDPSSSPADIAGAMQGVDVDMEHSPAAYELPAEVVPQPSVVQYTPFVLSAAPVSRFAQGPNGRPLLSTNVSTRNAEEDCFPSPLTPLREATEGGPEISDDSEESVTRQVKHSPSASTSSQKGHQKSSYHQSTIAGRNSPRSSPPRSSRDEVMRKPVAEPLHKQRSNNTSGSGSSTYKLKPVRTSEDNSLQSNDNKGQTFEQLIRSDQTIQYTLTPHNMRNIEPSDASRHIQPTVLPNGYDSRRPPSGRSHASSVSKNPPLHIDTRDRPNSPKLVKTFKPVPRPVSTLASRTRPNGAQPRDARVDRDSMGDFADFIRSTGPTQGANQGTNGTRIVSSSVPRTSTASSVPRRAESSAGRNRLQARDAAVPRGDSISDLIDFVRSGPQLEKDTHRIPRTVAPFRTTMDSDQMAGAVGGKAIDASLPDPRFSQAPSVNSSVNSQSALLSHSSKMKSNSGPSSNDYDEQDMMPKRKTRRVRDPYAIDFSDEEDEYEATPRPKPIKEESLADFLRNVPPPPNSSAGPIFENQSAAANTLKQKSSTPSFRSRFSRKDSTSRRDSTTLIKPKSRGNDSTPSSRNGVPPIPTHTPIAAQYSTTNSHYEPQRSNYVSQLDTARNKVVQKTYQPREAAYSPHRTNDLADFLMREPPTQAQSTPKTFSPTQHKEEGTFTKMFGRRKVR